MTEQVKINIDRILKIAKPLSCGIVLTVAILILLNFYKINSGFELSNTEEHLAHLLTDHKINESNFEINISSYATANTFINSAEMFTISSLTINLFPGLVNKMWLNSPDLKNSFSMHCNEPLEGYCSLLIQPPRYIS